jgi:hypothetical protein
MVTTAAAPVGPLRRPLYMGVSVLMAVIAVVGFWPKYFGPLVFGTLVQPLLIHIHAIVFTGWLVLFFAQAALAATKRVRLHLKVGRVGIWYGLLLIVVGLTTGVLRAAGREGDGDGGRLLYAAVADMVMFSGFFATAIVYRKKPQLHRRAMVVAATSLLVAAVARMEFLPAGLFVHMALWSTPVLLAMGVEFRNTRRIHPMYLLGLAVFTMRRISAVPVAESAAWGAFAQWVFGQLA